MPSERHGIGCIAGQCLGGWLAPQAQCQRLTLNIAASFDGELTLARTVIGGGDIKGDFGIQPRVAICEPPVLDPDDIGLNR